jgi:transcriptional regulator with XRE-family HTH domain
MDAATVIRRAREVSGLSKRELARRAGTSPAAIVAYETGAREPTFRTLRRLLRAAGFDSEVVTRPAAARLDPRRAAERLAEVLDLADHLPQRKAARRLTFPPLTG